MRLFQRNGVLLFFCCCCCCCSHTHIIFLFWQVSRCSVPLQTQWERSRRSLCNQPWISALAPIARLHLWTISRQPDFNARKQTCHTLAFALFILRCLLFVVTPPDTHTHTILFNRAGKPAPSHRKFCFTVTQKCVTAPWW